MSGRSYEWDVFIAHASEDKDALVEPLATGLAQLGAKVWYDVFALRPGDSLSRKIDEGLARSRFGVVVVSPDFMRKAWPERELRGLVAREIAEGRVIIPLWFRVNRGDVLSFSPPLADAVAIRTEGMSAVDIAIQILRAVRPDLYDKHPRAELEQIANGQALRELQGELERFQCSRCSAMIVTLVPAPAEYEERSEWDLRAEYECGHVTFGGETERPCPSDPRFPRWEHFELNFVGPQPPLMAWRCYPQARTRWAFSLHLNHGFARTREEAERAVREQYDRLATPWKA